MITCDKIKNDVNETQCCHIFEYKGKSCGIDPWWDGKENYNVWYGEKDFVAKNWKEVVTTKFFDGKSLEEITGDIKNYEES